MNNHLPDRRSLNRRAGDTIRDAALAMDSAVSDRDSLRAAAANVERKALTLILARSRAVKTDISTCSTELGRAHDIVRLKVSDLSNIAAADELLKDSNTIKMRVLECANDLNIVNHALARAINSLRETEISLADALDVLARTEAALASAESEKRRAEMLLLRDLTTGLPNRRMFDDRLEQAMSMADRHGWTLAVMFMDLDRFKNINDVLGHAAGDEVLKEVARRLMTHTRDEDTACRNGGDEFLFLLGPVNTNAGLRRPGRSRGSP